MADHFVFGSFELLGWANAASHEFTDYLHDVDTLGERVASYLEEEALGMGALLYAQMAESMSRG